VAAVTAEAEQQRETREETSPPPVEQKRVKIVEPPKEEETSPPPVEQKRVKVIEPPKEETPEEEPRADTATPPQTLQVHKHRPGFGLQSPLKPEILHKTGPRKLKHQGRIDEENGSAGSQDSLDGEQVDEIEEQGLSVFLFI
jgi:hypothetical protein